MRSTVVATTALKSVGTAAAILLIGLIAATLTGTPLRTAPLPAAPAARSACRWRPWQRCTGRRPSETVASPYAAWLGHWERSYVEDDKVAALLEFNGVPWPIARAIMAIRSERRFEQDERGTLVVHSKLIGGVWGSLRCGEVDESSFFGYRFHSRLDCRRDAVVAVSSTTDWSGVSKTVSTAHLLKRGGLLHVQVSAPGGGYLLVMRKTAARLGGRQDLRWLLRAPADLLAAMLGLRNRALDLLTTTLELRARALARLRTELTHALVAPAELLADARAAAWSAAMTAAIELRGRAHGWLGLAAAGAGHAAQALQASVATASVPIMANRDRLADAARGVWCRVHELRAR